MIFFYKRIKKEFVYKKNNFFSLGGGGGGEGGGWEGWKGLE